VYVHTSLNDEYSGGGTDAHSRALNPELIQVKQVRQKMKERALKEVTSVGMIYDEEIAKATMTRLALAIFPADTEICKYF
jgi:surfactin synthase thioesterase subunit